MNTPTPSIALRRLAEDRLEEFTKVDALLKRHRTRIGRDGIECGLTSALRLEGIELPLIPRNAPYAAKLDVVHLMVDSASARRRWKGARFHLATQPALNALPEERRHEYAPRHIAQDVYVTHPLLTWAQMSRTLDREELTVLADSMMRRNHPSTHFTPDDFRELMTLLPAGQGFKGRAKCLWACEMMRENTDSSVETRMRLKLWGESIPELQGLVVNHRITVDGDEDGSGDGNGFDGRSGSRGRGGVGSTLFLDMALPELRIGIEYAGRHHAEQWSADLSRQTAIAASGWTLLSASHETMSDPARWREFVSHLTTQILRSTT